MSESGTGHLASADLAHFLAHADAHAPAIELARARVGLNDAELVEASIKLPSNPIVSASAGARTAGTLRGFQFNVAVMQRFEIAGESIARQEAATARREVALALVDEVTWQVHVEARRLYRQLVLAATVSRQASDFVAFARRWRALVEAEVEAGESSPVLLKLADAELASTQAELLDAQRQEAMLRARLAAVIGWPEPEVMLEPDVLPPLLEELPPFDALLTKLEANHPALRARELDVVAHQANLELARREAWIKPSFGVSYGQEPSLGQGFDANIWLVQMNLPLPTWRRNQSGVAMASASVAIAHREKDVTFMKLRGELFEAWSGLDAAHRRVKLYEDEIVPEMETSLEALQQAYELGELDLQAVLQMRQQLLEVMKSYQSARRDYHEALAMIEGLTGWKSEVER